MRTSRSARASRARCSAKAPMPITHLVSKNAGGSGRAKLDAAAHLALPILMVERPAPPPGPLATSVPEAVVWAVETVGIGA